MKTKFVAIILAFFALFTGCDKETTPPVGQTTPVKVFMTDAPGNFQQVNVDIIGVEFKNDNGNTMNLNVIPGVYNLLDFTNGLDTLIAFGDFPAGKLSQVRLILGQNNSVMVDNVIYPLETPSAQQSGLKINVHDILIAGVVYSLLLDFDANQSIVLTGNNNYQLKPVIRAVNLAISGSIHGTVATVSALPASISATDGINTYTTNTNVIGDFLLIGIPAGTYSVTITPQPPYIPAIVPNVLVTVGNLTELGPFTF